MNRYTTKTGANRKDIWRRANKDYQALLEQGLIGCDRCRQVGLPDADERPSRLDPATGLKACCPGCLTWLREPEPGGRP